MYQKKKPMCCVVLSTDSITEKKKLLNRAGLKGLTKQEGYSGGGIWEYLKGE